MRCGFVPAIRSARNITHPAAAPRFMQPPATPACSPRRLPVSVATSIWIEPCWCRPWREPIWPFSSSVMDRERYWIGLAAAHLVRQLPLTVITAVADAVERVVDASSPSAHSSVLHDLPNPEFRDMAAKFLHVWRDKAPALPSQAVAAALTAAAHVERDHLQNESIEIVWTGPETADTRFRHTEQAILEVLRSEEHT